MKRKWAILIPIVLLGIGCVLSLPSHAEHPIAIQGILPAKDLADITSAFEREKRIMIKQLILHPGSPSGIRHLPHNIKNISRFRIDRIYVANKTNVSVRVNSSAVLYWYLSKGTNGWQFNGAAYF